ncbi:penicillin-binding protein [Merismopedia glauca CCAP 1448/3]|uniref:Penicillin-binding protein n=2 Tax=Merismopedia TaxID=53402 RepID=A0A2T1C5X5_9CYAN|nr:penicillin-binding protein [Merismopedia glauca CCAP 1448/3]
MLKLLGLSVGTGAIALGAGWLALENSLPKSAKEVLNYTRPQTLTIKAANGTIIKQIGDATREEIKIDQVPKPLLQAFIATEDRRFYQHEGVDYQGILRAVLSNLQAKDVVEGGSTITQQVARMVFFDQERNIWRKLREFRMAQKIEGELKKEQILERYLNLVYLGQGAYGIADAAWVYFSKPIDRLTLPEMAMLAALPASPSQFSPVDRPKSALQRRNLVLARMQESGYITASEAENAKKQPILVNSSRPKRLEQQAPYFTQFIQQELPQYVSPEVLKVGGLTVETTLNPKWQSQAETAVNNIIQERGKEDNFSQAALVAINPRNGQIEAMVGGKNFGDNQFNRVTQAQRQPGSTFKMFVYTTAIAAGYSPYRSYLDAPVKVDEYQPKNFSEGYSGWISMRDALVDSVNVIALKVLLDVGWNPTIETAKKMGIESDLKPTYSLALGGSEVNLLELTSAYGTLANKGVHVKPHAIRRIIDQKGQVIYQDKISSQKAIDEDTSAIMTWMLRAVVNEGTGQKARLGDRQVAGKTGTSDEARDLLFVGYIPQLVTGVWLGNDDNKPTWGASSSAAETWHKFMEPVVKEIPPEDFPKRPEKLEGREALIEVEPIKPKAVETPQDEPKTASDNEEDTPKPVEANTAQSERPRRTRRRVVRSTEETNDNQTETRRSRRRRVRTPEETTEKTSGDRTETKRSRRRRVRTQEETTNNPPENRKSRRKKTEKAENNSDKPAETRRSRRKARVKTAEPPTTEKPPTKRRVRSSRKSTSTSPVTERKTPTRSRTRTQQSSSSEAKRSTRTRTYHEPKGSAGSSRSDKE